MGMLTQEEVTIALKNNLAHWEWDIRPSYPLNPDEAKAILLLLGDKNEGEMQK